MDPVNRVVSKLDKPVISLFVSPPQINMSKRRTQRP